MMVFWSSDPESTSGAYARRSRERSAGFGPRNSASSSCTSTRTAHRPRSCSAAAGFRSARARTRRWRIAIMNVWVREGLYDHDYVEKRTTGFDAVARLPPRHRGRRFPRRRNGRKPETGVPAHVVRALARAWGKKKTYLAAGGAGAGLGGACRTATGAQWARSMILMMAMQGWGKPGINFGNLQAGTPLDFTFYFPGYAEGGISGELRLDRVRDQQLRAHAARADDESGEADDPAAALPRRDHRRPVQGLSVRRLVARSAVRALRVSDARILAGAHAVSLRRLVVRDDRQLAPLHRGVSAPVARVRRQPVDLVRGRGEVRRRDPARLHVVRALGHRRMGERGRLRPSSQGQLNHRDGRHAAQVHRAARRIEVRLPDLPRDPAADGDGRALLGGLQRARLGEARVRVVRPGAST